MKKHRQHLEIVFQRLKKYGITINVAKNKFGEKKMDNYNYSKLHRRRKRNQANFGQERRHQSRNLRSQVMSASLDDI